jgi:hypothetical protein
MDGLALQPDNSVKLSGFPFGRLRDQNVAESYIFLVSIFDNPSKHEAVQSIQG